MWRGLATSSRSFGSTRQLHPCASGPPEALRDGANSLITLLAD